MTDSASIFEARNVWVRLGSTDALRGVDFALGSGEFVVLLGPNGSGKTTLVKALLGVVQLTRGSRAVFGQQPEAFKRWHLIGYVPQRIAAASGVPATVNEVVLSGRAAKLGLLGRYRASDHAAAARALDLADIAELARSRVETLSAGQQQRVLIARALATDPAVLVMDEPVASIDLAHQESFAGTLRQLHAAGTSVLLVAHSLGAMKPLAQRAVVIEHGVVVHDGSVDQANLIGHPHPHHPDAAAGL
ncbi:MAG: metal ABC transporter ATP-binding protein [Actinomycetota bacterium]|nr:metal ABC transporter ATP-binding protein [Actinomycetota bacterium]